MKFSELGYRGTFVEIAPSNRVLNESSIFMLGTSYGNPDLIETIFDECEREYLASNQDFDVTSPFPKLTCLDAVGNRLYTTLLFLNDYVYNLYNRNNFSEGFEFLLMQKINSKIYWSQVGWPNLFIMSKRHIQLIDSSLGQRSIEQAAPNLPHSLLGIHNSLNFRIETATLKDDEELLFVKNQNLSSNFFQANASFSNENIIKNIFRDNANFGAWLGRLSFSDSEKVEENIAQNL